MQALTMDYQLTIPAILRRTRAHFGDKRIIARRNDGSITRTTYAALLGRADRLGAALRRLGAGPGEPVATLCWNHDRHLEAYYAIPSMGGVLHTLNLRLSGEELAHIAADAGDHILIVDEELVPLAQQVVRGSAIERIIVVRTTDAPLPPGWADYEALLEGETTGAPFQPDLPESAAAAMCYTSGTTGRSKGVVYSHRAIALHSLMLATADSFGLSERDVVLPAVAMFHANAWGLPFAAALVGADLVLPGRHLDAPNLRELLLQERVTVTAGVPTIWLGLLELLDATPADLSSLRALVIGGAPLPEALLQGLRERHSLPVIHSWGMTELAPVGTLGRIPSRLDGEAEGNQPYRLRAGTPGPFLELRARNEHGTVPWDDVAVGELEVRGPTVARGYHGQGREDSAFTTDGWFRTGDVVSIDAWGSVAIRDRAKDLVKSGGEWISSAALENRLMNHPAVLEAAVVAVPHPRWQERPLAAVVLRAGASVTADELRAFLGAAFPAWWLPEEIAFVDSLPRTSTGKVLKSALRERFRDHYASR